MMPSARQERRPSRASMRGLTLVELMVALLIGVFLIGGLVSLLQAMKRATTVQSGMSQLVDNERFALDLLTDVIQTAGDLDPNIENAAEAFPAGTYTTTTAYPQPALTYAFAAQQFLHGSDAVVAAASRDTFVIRASTTGTDQLIDCIGATSLTRATFVNIFSLDDAGNLQCELYTIDLATGAVGAPQAATLVSGIHSMSVSYGIKSNAASAFLAADAYMDAAAINALPQTSGSGWSMVRSIRLTLTFVNPLYGAPGQPAATPGQAGSIAPFVSFTRVIDLKRATGVGET